MKMKYQHPALRYHNPLTGEYDENESINKDGVIYVKCKYEVCYQCNGHGVHVRRDIDDSRLNNVMSVTVCELYKSLSICLSGQIS
jgi:hypothetical protein